MPFLTSKARTKRKLPPLGSGSKGTTGNRAHHKPLAGTSIFPKLKDTVCHSDFPPSRTEHLSDSPSPPAPLYSACTAAAVGTSATTRPDKLRELELLTVLQVFTSVLVAFYG
ncbi:UNVERIFIED_CONTAM: hypothetical protein FKN15_017829 [Acipenser sinensis]